MEVLHAHCAKIGRDPKEILPIGGGWLVVRDNAKDAGTYLEKVAKHHGIGAPVPRAAGDPDTVARLLFDYWKAGARGFVCSGAFPYDTESIERIGREVKPRLMKLIQG
ncbi:MAG: hypothetical protein LC663_03180 [Actinobacteria bacterium]|nr:hypothetical protein [Actinomycetota bacterium]